MPTFKLSNWFLVFVIGSELFQHIVTLIPEVGGWKTKWHGILTSCSAILLLPAMLLIATASELSAADRIVAVVGLVVMIGVAGYHLLFANKESPRHQLALQAGYYGVFFVAVLSATY